ncbi:MAG: hypothetical protein JWO05_378 [Gemmatimonadetes bacterium]|nr:hypothetical protein [Gemmatimonadota bacterium]
MLYICIPSHDEAPTIGLLLWRIRKVLQESPREYEILVYDDGSTDSTAETLAPYTKVLPLTILGGPKHVGYAAALDTLLREAARRTRYPRRDAILTLQGDFTDQPEHIPEIAKRFEGGADLVIAERPASASSLPVAVKRLSRVAPWILKPFASVPGVKDPFGSLRLYRVSLVRDLLKAAGDKPLVSGEGWSANAGLLLKAAPLARRIETLELEPRYDLRPRDSRVRPWNDAMRIFRFGRDTRAEQRAQRPVTA